MGIAEGRVDFSGVKFGLNEFACRNCRKGAHDSCSVKLWRRDWQSDEDLISTTFKPTCDCPCNKTETGQGPVLQDVSTNDIVEESFDHVRIRRETRVVENLVVQLRSDVARGRDRLEVAKEAIHAILDFYDLAYEGYEDGGVDIYQLGGRELDVLGESIAL